MAWISDHPLWRYLSYLSYISMYHIFFRIYFIIQENNNNILLTGHDTIYLFLIYTW